MCSRGRIDKALQLLSLESPAPVVKQGSKWILTAANLTEAFWQRAERLTALRRAEQQQMQEYVALRSRAHGVPDPRSDGDPGRFTLPNLAPLPTTVDEALAQKRWLFSAARACRWNRARQWPTGGLPQHECQWANRSRAPSAARQSPLRVGRRRLG